MHETIVKKKLLIATDCFIPRWDGIARFLIEIIPSLQKKYDITVIAPDFSGDFRKIDGVRIVRIPLMKWKVGDFEVPKFAKETIKVEVEKADIIWTQTIASVGGTTINVAAKLGKKVVAYIHSIDWDLVSNSMSQMNLIRNFARTTVKFFAKRLYNKCTHLMVPSEEVAELLSYNGVKTQCSIVRLGVDTSEFSPLRSKRKAKEAIGIDPNKTVIGYVGRLAREKDLVTLYRGFARVRKLHPNIKLLIVGDGIADVKDKLAKKPDVIMVGKQNDVVPYYQAMDMYVLPSLTETTSLTTLEAMSCGVCCICTPVGYIKNYIKEKENGVLFPKQNALVLSLKLDWLLNNSNIMGKLGIEARITVVEDFSWKSTIKDINDVLKEIM